MLFTRCPECETTFRITEEALQKAAGQVRCGRCTHIFNAYQELREATATDAPGEDKAPAAAAKEQGAGIPLHEEIVLETVTSASAGVAQSAEEDVETAITSNQFRALDELSSDSGDDSPEWLRESELRSRPMDRRLWVGAAVVGGLLLSAQLIGHFQSRLVAQPLVGPLLQKSFALFGAEIEPIWNVDQYDLLDWVAVAEPSATGQGNLIIRSRVQNKGPAAQPRPYIYLKLIDRWEDTLGSRIFAPEEYLPQGASGPELLTAGMTYSAELILVDPGPDAYGFELDVCVRVDEGFHCSANQAFR
jgi:predicted Zn finger-like uncharacterized protein